MIFDWSLNRHVDLRWVSDQACWSPMRHVCLQQVSNQACQSPMGLQSGCRWASQVSASKNADDEAQKEKEPGTSEPASPASEASEPAALEPEFSFASLSHPPRTKSGPTKVSSWESNV